MSLRLLDTGTARDVSGVVRITAGDEVEVDDRDIQRRIEEKELLYFVGGDGGVKVFERGQ
jgi:elongator complex protein 6